MVDLRFGTGTLQEYPGSPVHRPRFCGTWIGDQARQFGGYLDIRPQSSRLDRPVEGVIPLPVPPPIPVAFLATLLFEGEEVTSMTKMTVRKPGAIRLTARCAYYCPCCG